MKRQQFDEGGEDFCAVLAGQAKGQLRVQQAVTRSEVIAAVLHLEGEVAFRAGQFVERGGNRAGAGPALEQALDEIHDGGREHVQTEEAEIVAGTQPGDEDSLFGLRGSGLFEHGVDAVQAGLAVLGLATHGAELRELSFAGGLDGGNRTILLLGGGDEARGTAGAVAAHEEVIAHHVKEGLRAGEGARARERMGVAARLGLFDEADTRGVLAGGGSVGCLIAGANHDRDLFHAGPGGFFEQDSEDAALDAIAVDEHLQGQPPLGRGGGGEDTLFDPHHSLFTIESMSAPKTNAMRLLDSLGIEYEVRTYEVDPDDLSAETVARKIGFPVEQTFKTLVARGERSGVCLAVIPGNAELDLKALARALGDRRADVVPLKEVQPLTGYVRGGVTALACRKEHPVFLDEFAQLYDRISVSAGARGVQVLLSPADYVRATGARYAEIAKDK